MVVRNRYVEKFPNRYYGGRRKGSRNKMTVTLKEAILRAAQLAGGGDEYGLITFLFGVAVENPEFYCQVLLKVLPYTIQEQPSGPIQMVALPQDVLKRCTDQELAVIEVIYERLAQLQIESAKTIDAEPLADMLDVDDTGTRH